MGRRKKLLADKYQISDRPAQQESLGIEVKLGWDISSSESVTVKAFDLAKFDNQEGVRELIRFEMNTLWRLDHPNVVRLVDVFTSPARNKTFVVMEAVSGGGDLFETIAAKGRLEDDPARHYFAQLLDAVEHCHTRGVCHRDIKPENVLLDAKGNVKLTGFALAGLFDPSLGDNHIENLLHATCGTPDYTAPEVIQGFAYEGAAADVWSLGVTLYAMLAGYLPFEAESLPGVFDKAQAGHFKAAPEMSVEARSLLDCMLEPNPENRYTMCEVRAHPWLAGRTQKQMGHQEKDERYNDQHHRQPEEDNFRRAERSPRSAVGSHGWPFDSLSRRQQRQQRQQQEESANLGPTDELRGQEWCEQQNKSPEENPEGAESPIFGLGGRWMSCNNSATPSSSQCEGGSPFHDRMLPSEGEEEMGKGVRGRAELNHADQVGDSSCSSGTSIATAAPPCFSRLIWGSKTTAGTISIARRLGATRLVLSLRLLNSDAAGTAETDRATHPGDDSIDGLIPAKALQRALESLGCVCRLLLPTNKRSDERKAPRVKVKACRAMAADGVRCGGEHEVDEEEEDSIVGIKFSVMPPAEARAPAEIASLADEVDSIAGRLRSSCTLTMDSSSSSSSSDSNSNGRSGRGREKIHLPETTEFLAVLSTGTVSAFDALVACASMNEEIGDKCGLGGGTRSVSAISDGGGEDGRVLAAWSEGSIQKRNENPLSLRGHFGLPLPPPSALST
eukprot:g14734.t1